jgi:hypothetical protein
MRNIDAVILDPPAMQGTIEGSVLGQTVVGLVVADGAVEVHLENGHILVSELGPGGQFKVLVPIEAVN